MRHDKLVPGAILITLGLIFLLQSFNLLHIHWGNILYLWPIFLLIGGINLIFANNRTVWASTLKIGVVILGLGILLFGNFDNSRNGWWPHYVYHYNSDNDDDDDNDGDKKGIVRVEGNSTFNLDYNDSIHIGKLNINGGAASYEIRDTTNQMFQAFTKDHGGLFSFKSSVKDTVAVLNFNMKDGKHIMFGKNKGNKATIKLNTKPIWDIDVNIGAAGADFDLTKFKIRNLNLNAGAAGFNAKLGEPLKDTRIDINTGAAGVDISIPKDAACKIISSGLSSDDFEGFTKVGDDHYETPGYASAKNKFYIKLDGAFVGFKVRRY